MLDANKKITLIHKVFNKETRQDSYEISVIEGCSWFETIGTSLNSQTDKPTNIVKVRIPTFGKNIPNIDTGDILILGDIETTENLTEGEIRKRYKHSMIIESLTKNDNSLPYSQHIRISGA